MQKDCRKSHARCCGILLAGASIAYGNGLKSRMASSRVPTTGTKGLGVQTHVMASHGNCHAACHTAPYSPSC